jgi:hypothetical protein
MNPTDWAAFVLACLSIAAILIGGLRYIIRHEVPLIIDRSHIVSRIEKLEEMVLELLTNDRSARHGTKKNKGTKGRNASR